MRVISGDLDDSVCATRVAKYPESVQRDHAKERVCVIETSEQRPERFRTRGLRKIAHSAESIERLWAAQQRDQPLEITTIAQRFRQSEARQGLITHREPELRSRSSYAGTLRAYATPDLGLAERTGGAHRRGEEDSDRVADAPSGSQSDTDFVTIERAREVAR
jgi:hypothetical protein